MTFPTWSVARVRSDRERVVFAVRLADGCPFFDGHFPGRPVLPAVAQLRLIVELLEREGHRDARITGVSGARFERPIAPGATLEVQLSATPPGAPLRFELRADDDTVSRGTLDWSLGTDA